MLDTSRPQRLLFIGNSYTNRNDLPGLLTRLAAASDPPVEVVTERVIANGASLRQHWNAGRALELLRAERWDVVVLQEQSTLPVKNPGRYHENVRLFAPVIQEQGARTLLFGTWARRNAPETQSSLDVAVFSIAQEAGAVVAPVGAAWERVRAAEGAPELFEADGSHPTAAGTYLAACVFYAVLLGRSPEGLPAEGLKLAPEQIQLLQRTAGEAARQGVPGAGR